MKSILTLAVGAALAAATFAPPARAQAPEAAQTPTPAAAASEELERVKMSLFRAQKTLTDWANLNRYKAENAQLSSAPPAPGRVVFMGDSITDNWGRKYGKFFPGKPYVNRGISGQTTPQMLIRFRPDVIALKPKAVVILAGTNDIAGNTGAMTLEEIEGNLQSMAELAKVAGIQVLLASVMPTSDYYHKMTDRRPNEKIVELNQWIQDYCKKNNLIYVDYYTAMLDDQKVLKKELSDDGLHPNATGYDVITPVVEKAIAQALGQ